MSLPLSKPTRESRPPITNNNSLPQSRKMSSSASRRRKSVTYKESGFSVPNGQGSALGSSPSSIRSPLPATLTLDEEDEEYAVSVAELKSKGITAKRNKKSQELVFQCEKCSKWYRHPACLVKHRWQHTDYWQQAASLMLSKHQSVMLLEAAAILTNGTSLPDEKSLWPAAVSPRSSGLLGSEYLNSDVLRAVNIYEARSPADVFTSFSLPALSGGNNRDRSPNEGESGSDDMLVDIEEEDDQVQVATNDEDIFAMDDDFDSLAITQPITLPAIHHSRASTATTDHDSGYSSGRAGPAHSPPVSHGMTHVYSSKGAASSRLSAMSAYNSAPQLGFFEPRKFSSSASASAQSNARESVTGFPSPPATSQA